METKEFIEKPVKSLFSRYLIPSIMGTMVTSIYVLADTIMIGKGLGSVAMAALNIALPIYNIFFGLGLLFGVGGSVLMSIYRGRGEKEKADAYYTAAFLMNLAVWLILQIFVVVKHFCNTLFENSPGISSFKWCFPIIVGMRTDMIVPYVHISV